MTHERPTFEVRSPRDGAVLETLPVDDADSVGAAVAAARSAAAGWASRSPFRRAESLGRLGRVFEDQADAIVETIVAETGKPRAEALAEVVVCVDLIRFYRDKAPRHLGPRRVGSGWMLWKKSWIERVPLGVVGAITPWNYPLILVMDTVTAALAGGNAVVVKPSEFTPLTARMIPDLCARAGLPDDLVRIVTGDGTTGEALVRSGVDKISFTGSTAVGRKVMSTAAETLTPVTMELGGKDPAIVLEDADLDRAARGIAFGGFFNAGQTCISIERVLVVESVAVELTRRLAEEAAALRVGTDSDSDIGPMITAPQFEKVREQLRDAVAKGARVVAGGLSEASRPDAARGLIAPTVLADVDDTMAIYREETFGPVLPVIVVKDEEEAVRRANDTSYGLFASVWTGNRRRGVDVARRLRTGGACINDSLTHYGVAALPMGGVGDSGFGSRRGLEGLDELTRPRALLADRAGLGREPWWFPYDERGERLTRAVLTLRARGGLGGMLGAVRRLLGR